MGDPAGHADDEGWLLGYLTDGATDFSRFVEAAARQQRLLESRSGR